MQPDGILVVGKCSNFPEAVMVIIRKFRPPKIEPFTIQVPLIDDLSICPLHGNCRYRAQLLIANLFTLAISIQVRIRIGQKSELGVLTLKSKPVLA